MGLSNSPKSIEEHYILDNRMLFRVDKTYAQTGCEEGWLELIHGHTDYRSIHINTYRMIGTNERH